MRYIFRQSHRCPYWAETICRTDRAELMDYTLQLDGVDHVVVSAIPDVEKGLVLTDSRGRGAFQR